ncbi:sulfatase-like hydrolase/transferase [Berryella wangjianweii]|uniref:Sulfatase-like hydrolase/transferase n=1 Tax=Berryella wangjianweii TaxID=2734634 RepID=A0A6M8IXT3_9ACTN|nr:sulfatase-like hydrolase/transferase [Berryella wangjianweii]QKF07655.1 sulfatase-like hydrolase/transferase [Berryella wangjianweii]
MNHASPRPATLWRRAALAAFDAACALCLAALASLALAPPAWAYVDPSVMTYTIQALAGVAVALSTVAGVLMRRTRRKLVRALGIDENRNKEVEPAVRRLDAQGRPVGGPVPAAAPEAGRARRRAGGAGAPEGTRHRPGRRPEPRRRLSAQKARRSQHAAAPRDPWRVRLAKAAVVWAFASGTLLITAPYEIVSGNEGSLVFGLAEVWHVMAVPAVALAALMALLTSLLKGRAFNAALLAPFGFGTACYVQALLLNPGLPSADGQTVAWADYTGIASVSLIVWLALLAGPLVLSRLHRRRAQTLAVLVATALLVVQAAGVTSLFLKESPAADDAEAPTRYAITRTGLNTVTPRNNLVVFVLDGFDTKCDLIPLMQQHPRDLDELTGFTWFRNSAPTMTATIEALPTMLTGNVPDPTQSTFRGGNSFYRTAPYLKALASAGYSVGLYSDSLDGEAPGLFEHTVNGVDGNGDSGLKLGRVDAVGTFRALLSCALYRDLPWVLKPGFRLYTSDIDAAMALSPAPRQEGGERTLSALEPDPTPYVLNDKSYYDRLRKERLSVLDDGSTGSVRFIHLQGPHYPHTLDENVNEHQLTSRTQQARASLRIVSEYIRQLKELGLYDDTTIVITADHGYRSESNFQLIDGQLEMSPIMLVKPAHAPDRGPGVMDVSDNPVCTADVMPTLLAQAPGVNREGFAPDMYAMTDPQRLRNFYFCIKTPSPDLKVIGFMELAIQGDALDFANWTCTGTVFEFSEPPEITRKVPPGSRWRQIGGTEEYERRWVDRLYWRDGS